MKFKNRRKITTLIVSFLLLIPFRLPIGVLFINATTHIAQLMGNLEHNVLAANVVVTKIIYDLVLSALSVYNLEKLIQQVKGRPALSPTSNIPIYWLSILIGILLFAYICFDGVTTYNIYYQLQGLEP